MVSHRYSKLQLQVSKAREVYFKKCLNFEVNWEGYLLHKHTSLRANDELMLKKKKKKEKKTIFVENVTTQNN